MIKARMYWPRLRMEISGHAGYDEKGKDIVCAGVSALLYALAAVLDDAEKRGRTTAELEESEGAAVIWADPGMGSLNEVKAYFRMCVKGIKVIQEQYPQHVEIKEVQ